MTTTIAVTKSITILVNVLAVEPENQQKLIHLLRESTEGVVSKLDGWISTSFIAAKDGRRVVISRSGATSHQCKRCKPIPICLLTSRSL